MPKKTTKSSSWPVESIPISSISIPDQPDRFQPGTSSIDDLASSISEHGLLQPILVSPLSENSSYELVAGHRRLLACSALGHLAIDARVADFPRESLSAVRLTENIQREELNPLEEAVAISRLRSSLDLTQEQAAERLGKGLSWLKKRESLLRLPDDVMDALQSGQVNPSVALELGRIEDDHTRKYYLQSAIDYGATQDVAAAWVSNWRAQGSTADPQPLQVSKDNFEKAVRVHKLPCNICEQAFPLPDLKNFFACSSCIDVIAGAARGAAS